MCSSQSLTYFSLVPIGQRSRREKVLSLIIQCTVLRRDREQNPDWRESKEVRRGSRGSDDVARGVTAEQVVGAEVKVDCRPFGVGQVGG